MFLILFLFLLSYFLETGEFELRCWDFVVSCFSYGSAALYQLLLL